jgi:hypothetical protein
VRQLCADRAIAAAIRAIDLGYSDVARAQKLVET